MARTPADRSDRKSTGMRVFSAMAQGAVGPPQHQPRELRQPGTAQGQAAQLSRVG